MDSSVSFFTDWDLVEVLSSQRWGGGEPLFYLVQMPHQLSRRERDELLIWRSQLSSQKSLSTLLQTTEKCHVRNLLFQSIRPCLCCPAKVFCEVETGAFWYNHPDLNRTSPEKILEDLGTISAWHLLLSFHSIGSASMSRPEENNTYNGSWTPSDSVWSWLAK